MAASSECLFPEMIKEAVRYGSFASNLRDWIRSSSPHTWPSRLAQEGYFNDSTNNTIRCFSCGRANWGHRTNCCRDQHNVPSDLYPDTREKQRPVQVMPPSLQLRRHVVLVTQEEDFGENDRNN